LSKYKARYEARYSIRYRTRSPDLTKESRSIDRAETENHGAERKESRHDSRAEINSFEDEDPKPVPRSLTEEGSVRGRSLQSSSSTGSTRNQDQLFVVR
jgi:hypothetical protein